MVAVTGLGGQRRILYIRNQNLDNNKSSKTGTGVTVFLWMVMVELSHTLTTLATPRICDVRLAEAAEAAEANIPLVEPSNTVVFEVYC